jgi:hypothetical protein
MLHESNIINVLNDLPPVQGPAARTGSTTIVMHRKSDLHGRRSHEQVHFSLAPGRMASYGPPRTLPGSAPSVCRFQAAKLWRCAEFLSVAAEPSPRPPVRQALEKAYERSAA